jgi:hypothetical protein
VLGLERDPLSLVTTTEELLGKRGAHSVVVKTLGYKPEGRGFEAR